MKSLYNNVEGHRLLFDGSVVEDVTTVALPSLAHTTTQISNVSGMAMDIDMPNQTHFEAMELGVNHNNGENSKLLPTPGTHNVEFRVVRQKLNFATREMEHESVKFRMLCSHKSTEKGSIEKGNPYGSTDKYSVLRYEEEVNGEIIVIVDSNGTVRFNGRDYSDDIDSLLA